MNHYESNQDDINRIFCPLAGSVGHHFCGWCAIHNLPRFQCGCLLWKDRSFVQSNKNSSKD